MCPSPRLIATRALHLVNRNSCPSQRYPMVLPFGNQTPRRFKTRRCETKISPYYRKAATRSKGDEARNPEHPTQFHFNVPSPIQHEFVSLILPLRKYRRTTVRQQRGPKATKPEIKSIRPNFNSTCPRRSNLNSFL